jgi:hypothetical protein
VVLKEKEGGGGELGREVLALGFLYVPGPGSLPRQEIRFGCRDLRERR